MKEAAILKDCLQWLKRNCYMHWRQYTGAVLRGGGKEMIRYSKNPNKGFPDLCGILKNRPGVLFACELKTDIGKLSQHQLDWLCRLRRAGVAAFTARSVAEMAAFLDLAEQGQL